MITDELQDLLELLVANNKKLDFEKRVKSA